VALPRLTLKRTMISVFVPNVFSAS